MTPRKLSGLFAVAGLLPFAAAAATGYTAPVVSSEHDYFEELPVVLSVSRLAQPLNEAPGAVTVIDREMVRQSGARHVVDLLRLVPGFQVAHVPNGAPGALYHGLAEGYPRHMQVLVDGRSQYSPFFIGGVNWHLIPVSLDDIDHVEVIRGSNSAAYGSNAFLGVVNIVTRHSADTPVVAAEIRTGTQGVDDRTLRLGAAGTGASFRFTGEIRRDEGFERFRDSLAHRLNDLRADWRLGPRDELQLQLGEIETRQQMGNGTVSDPLREQRQSQQYVQLGWRRTLNEGEEVGVRYYRAEEKAADAYSFPFAIFTVPVNYGFRSVRNNLEATHTFRPWRDTRLVWGGEMRSDAVTAPMFYGRTDAVALTVGRLFGNLEWRLAPAWLANLGATWEYDSNVKTTFAPRLAMNWHFMPGQTLRAVASRAYRAPSLMETRGNWAFSSSSGVALDRKFLATNVIRPELVTSRELGWLGEFKTLRLTGDVRLFQEKVDDRLVSMLANLPRPTCELLAPAPTCGTADRMYNVQNVRIRGVESQFRWQPLETTRLILNQSFIRINTDFLLPRWDPQTTLTYEGVTAGYDYFKDIAQTNSSAPTHATTLMWMQRLPGGFDLAATYHSVGAMKWSNNTYAPHWRRLDWRLAYPFRAGPTRGEVAFTVQSDGSPHVEHAVSEPVSRRGFVTLRFEY